MTRAELLAELARIVEREEAPFTDWESSYDTEDAHTDADAALVAFIDDAEIAAAYEAVPKWYS